MPQSYKVFIGASFIVFKNEAENSTVFNRKLTDPTSESLKETISELEGENEQAILINGNTEENWNLFSSHFKLIKAAGGLVENQHKAWLFIYRNDVWDLPKGKLELGETIEKCAVREVAEECGIEEPSIVKPLSSTYHTYILKGQRILKKTYWYMMKSEDTSELIPQTEEGITKVSWVSKNEAKVLAKKSYGSIREVILEELS